MLSMINILISVDSNYLDKAQTLLFSVRQHTQEDISIYLLNHRLMKSEICKFSSYLQNKCRMQLHMIDISNTVLDNFPVIGSGFTIETYYRILAQFLLPDSLDRILWLDADMVVLQDLASLYHQDFDGMMYVVCPDSKCDSNWVRECKEKLSLPESHVYFNAGMLLMDLKALRNGMTLEEMLQQCNLIRDKLTYNDQDILNYLYQNDVKYANWKKYNYQLIGINRIPKDELKQIVVLHYCGGNKPWNYWQLNNTSKYYWKVRVQQGYWREALQVYWRKIKEMTKIYLCELKDLLF